MTFPGCRTAPPKDNDIAGQGEVSGSAIVILNSFFD